MGPSIPAWLPRTIEIADYSGNWDEYLEAIYEEFCSDFYSTPLSFNGINVSAKRHPELEGKSATFWHIITSGNVETERTPDLNRCKSVLWPRAIIENAADDAVLQWTEDWHPGGPRTLLWLKDCNYLVVIAHRNGYCMLWTAYTTDYNHTQRKLQRNYERYRQQ